MKFKVGDRVESKQPGLEYTGVIEAISKGMVSVRRDGMRWQCRILDNGEIATADGIWDHKSKLIKLTNKSKKAKAKMKRFDPSKFNKDDRVVLIEYWDGNGNKISKGDFDPHSPIWGKDGNNIAGRVLYIESNCIAVEWDNGEAKEYNDDVSEIVLLQDAKKPRTGAFKKSKLNSAELDKLIIPKKDKEEIIAVLNQHQYQDKIFTEWGLGEVIEYGKGMTFLFHGPPGTGKTWGAQRIAKALNTELMIINAGNIQTSEPGGANRNIENAFKDAASSGKVLFLDECDSLIFNRQNLGMILASEVNTLLTEIEKFEGVVILATNRIEHMDSALERRISLIIEFPEPTEEQRIGIWKVLLPKNMPLAKNVSIEKLAKFAITGGLIKNAVLQAARLAVTDKAKKVDMKHFEASIERIQGSMNIMGRIGRTNHKVMTTDKKATIEIIKTKS